MVIDGEFRVVCHGVITLLIEKFSGDEVSVRSDGDRVVVSLPGRTHTVDRDAAAALRAELGEALTERCEYVHTVGTHRADGSYVVSRRGADSSGHRKVFDGFAALREQYATLPATFTAADVDVPGVTGGRRHLLMRHVVEHPAFDCTLTARQPLTAEKRSSGGRDRNDRGGSP
uniref:DUF7528 family protein n=1 Tax=Halococcus saccharolyticus TaxID=62319 RepID=UPI0012676646|nr:hypothetical protein [Halococcus saccharolyticus]